MVKHASKKPRVRRMKREFVVSGEYRTTQKNMSAAFTELAQYFAGLAKITSRSKPAWRVHRELAYALRNSHSASLPGSSLRIASNIMDIATDPAGEATILRSRQMLLDEDPSTDTLRMHGSIEDWAKKLATRIKEQTSG